MILASAFTAVTAALLTGPGTYFDEDFADITAATGHAWGESTKKDYANTDFELVLTEDGDNKALSPKLGEGGNSFAITAKLPQNKVTSPLSFSQIPRLVVQYDVTYNTPVTCGGSYVKLLSSPAGSISEVDGSTPYSIMFGPDTCNGEPKVHLIFKLKNPVDGSDQEVHCKQGEIPYSFFSDKMTHLVTLVVNSDNSYAIKLDNEDYSTGNLGNVEDCTPQNLPKEVLDPSDTKPADWPKEEIRDPDATQPEDWDEEMDDVWEAPTIPNPEYKEWEQKSMANPSYFHEPAPFAKLASIDAVSYELVVNDEGLQLDNLILCNDEDVAAKHADQTFMVRYAIQEAEKAAEQARSLKAGEGGGFGEWLSNPFADFFDSEITTTLAGALATMLLIQLGNSV